MKLSSYHKNLLDLFPSLSETDNNLPLLTHIGENPEQWEHKIPKEEKKRVFDYIHQNIGEFEKTLPYPPPKKPRFTFIDLFAGIGGFRQALQDLGGNCVFSSEWDIHAARTYYANYGVVPFGDIRGIDADSIPDHDILCAGFPCQPFSIAGVSKKTSLGQATGFEDEAQGTLFFEIKKILEANVRSFLSTRGKRNKGIQETLKNEPSRFMAYNNGLVLLTEELVVRSDDDGASFIEQMRGLQIVNGGQTTATIFFTKRDSSNQIDLSQVRVPAKIIVAGENNNLEAQEEFVGKVARFANTQNPIKESDFLAHSPFHRNFEKISQSIFCPDSVGRWFYERANGSYNTYLLREGKTPAQRRHITTKVTPRKRVIKKTELGQSIACWEGLPHIASLGGEKCLVNMNMKDHLEKDADSINVDYVKRRIAEYLIYYHTFYCLRGDICKQSPGVVRNYLVALLSLQFRESIYFDRIWLNQDLSDSFKTQIRVWGQHLYDAMIERSGGRQLSESGKRPQTWDYFKTCSLEPIRTKISEFRV